MVVYNDMFGEQATVTVRLSLPLLTSTSRLDVRQRRGYNDSFDESDAIAGDGLAQWPSTASRSGRAGEGTRHESGKHSTDRSSSPLWGCLFGTAQGHAPFVSSVLVVSPYEK